MIAVFSDHTHLLFLCELLSTLLFFNIFSAFPNQFQISGQRIALLKWRFFESVLNIIYNII